MAWSREHEDFLRENYGKISGSSIGNKIGKSREAVAAKADRMGLKSDLTPWSTMDRSYILKEKRRYDVDVEFPASDDSVPMIELGVGDCRWPCGDEFCGHDAAIGSSYCSVHHAMAYRGRG